MAKDHDYCHIGIERFARMEKAVSETREKVFNGLSSLPEQLKGLRNLIITLLTLTLFGGLGGLGFWIHRMGVIETKVDVIQGDFDEHQRWGAEQQRMNLEHFSQLDRAVDD